MSVSLLFVLLSWISVILCPTRAQDGGRELYFPAYYFFAKKHFENHLIQTMTVKDLDECEYRCYLNANCVSLNIKNKDSDRGTHECELNNSTHLEHDSDLKDSHLYYYRGAENKCGKNGGKCKNNSTCQSGFTQKKFRCFCTAGFEGEHCEKDIDECDIGSHNCHTNATCNNTKGGYNCSCKEGYTGDGQNCTDVDECASASHKCHANADCVNIHGSYNCTCKSGYIGDGHNCTDIDECAAQDNPCDAGGNSKCNNTLGSYYCQCNDGFVKNGAICEADVCRNYTTLTDGTRKYDHKTENSKCDFALNGWYRFQGAAGTKMVTTCPPVDRCDTTSPVWLSGDHPTVAEGPVPRKVCIHRDKNCCYSSVYIQVKNCSSYYIYKLLPPGFCYTRYCTTD